MTMSMASTSPNPLVPTFKGYIATTVDALILFEASLSGHLNHVPRRPHDRERPELIRSGNVFIYEEHASGIKRWTDGVSWSPSRILGNFLIYRELEKPFPPGEKKRALKKSRKTQVPNPVRAEPIARQASNSDGLQDPNDVSANSERSLIGSLVDSYPFKESGLVKKTISITYQGVPHHLVSYYSVADVLSGKLMTPGKYASLQHILPRSELLMQQNFRMPVQEDDGGDGRLAGVFASQPQYMGQGGMMHRGVPYQGTYMVQPGYTPNQAASYDLNGYAPNGTATHNPAVYSYTTSANFAPHHNQGEYYTTSQAQYPQVAQGYAWGSAMPAAYPRGMAAAAPTSTQNIEPRQHTTFGEQSFTDGQRPDGPAYDGFWGEN